MESSLSTFIQSPLFKFTVQSPDGFKDVQVHSAVIAEISPSLKAMMESPMSEGISKHATLRNVDFDAFQRLCQFAYRRQYADLQPELRKLSDQDDQRPVSPSDQESKINTVDSDDWFVPRDLKAKKSKKPASPFNFSSYEATEIVNKNSMALKFENMSYKTEQLPQWQVPQLEPREYDYSPVFISHARVYSIAKYYLCEDLCKLVLCKMHAMLKCFPMSCLAAADAIVQLIEHVYNDENLGDARTEPDNLRYLVTLYAATKTEDLGLAPPFVDLVEKGGPFVRSYWNLVCDGVLRSKEWETL